MTFDNVPWVVTMKKNDHYVRLSPSSLYYLTKKKKKKGMANNNA